MPPSVTPAEPLRLLPGLLLAAAVAAWGLLAPWGWHAYVAGIAAAVLFSFLHQQPGGRALRLDVLLLPCAWGGFQLCGSTPATAAWASPLLAAVLLHEAARLRRPVARLACGLLIPVVLVFALPWWLGAQAVLPDLAAWIFVSCALLPALVFVAGEIARPRLRPGMSADVVVFSNTGHTAQLAGILAQAMRGGGSEVAVHRITDHHAPAPALPGGILVLSFPVSGFTTPWHVTAWTLFRLPPGRGKPAIVLYSAAGGPENAGAYAWTLLTLKGYRVLGRLWAQYPMNFVTFRLGTKGFWRRADEGCPPAGDLAAISAAGSVLAREGSPRLSWPFFLLPTPLFLAGMLWENRLVDSLLCRGYAWKRRCTGCGLCARSCPTGRIAMDGRYPRVGGECTLCMNCVNLCPTNAMHILGLTEYGQPYRPRWPELVERGRGG